MILNKIRHLPVMENENVLGVISMREIIRALQNEDSAALFGQNLAEVEEKFGLKPNMVLDILAIMGDSADNIPGIKGIGPKTAVELLNQFGSLENMLNNTAEISSARKKELVLAGAEKALLSKKLI